MTDAILLEQLQGKCEAASRPELRKDKEMEHFRDSKKNENSPDATARLRNRHNVPDRELAQKLLIDPTGSSENRRRG